VRLRLLGDGDAVLLEEDRFACSLVWLGSDAPIRRVQRLEVHTVWTPTSTGAVQLGFAGVGHCLIRANGQPVLDEAAEAVGTDLAAALLSPPSRTGELDTTAGEPIELTLRYTPDRAGAPISDAMSFAFGLAADDRDPDALVAEAVELAAAADVVVLVVGTNSAVESEGFDRTDLRLPGEQDRLAEAVLAANPATVVVVNAGAPVELPWAPRAAATLLTWFGGQEYGHALGDVLTGAAEPGGRLPTTWPVRTTDLPVSQVAPRDGILSYDEDIHIGYRAWLRAGREPAHWFGAGAGYTTFEVGEPRLAAAHVRPGGQVSLAVAVRNTGARAGTHIVQLYASRAESTVDRPVRWLVGSAVVRLSPGETTDAAITIPARAFAHWTTAGWAHEPGVFSLAVGADAGHLGPAVEVELTP
jgi:beta-glucosidase